MKKEIYQVINIYRYYKDGKLIKKDKPLKLITVNISKNSLEAITEDEIEKGSILIAYFKIELYPYELMLNVENIERKGDMYKLNLGMIATKNQFYKHLEEFINKE